MQLDSKVKWVGKRSTTDLDEDAESNCKRVKIRDFESVTLSEGMASHYQEPSKAKTKGQVDNVEKDISQITPELLHLNSDHSNAERLSKKSLALLDEYLGLESLDLNSEPCVDDNLDCNETIPENEDAAKLASDAKSETDNDKNRIKVVGQRGLDLNAEDASSTVSLTHFYPSFKMHNVKVRDTWECGSSTGPLENSSLKKWAEMKQNGFISPNYGRLTEVPKQRGRKNKNETLKRKIDQAKKAQVDRFTKMAAPSGLLNGLNPGIINHVRNRKQVHSIIQALVNERGERNKDQVNVISSQMHQTNLPHGKASLGMLQNDKHICDYQMPKDSCIPPHEDRIVGYGDLYSMDGRLHGCTPLPSISTKNKHDQRALKLHASATMVSENASTLSMEESVDEGNVDSLSAKAANVAFHWLHLLHQDTKGRLAALHRSKKRVKDVITTELPFLLSKELFSKEGSDLCATSSSGTACSDKATAELHRTRWIMLFKQMEESLSEEERELELQLDQVNNMLEQCEKGLEYVQYKKAFGLPLLGGTKNSSRSGVKESDGELGVKAAAASIYSTCSFASSLANVKCC